MKIFSPRIHGVFDVLIIVAFALAPPLLGFGAVAASLCYVLAAFQGALTVLTAYPMGLLKMIPLPVHGGLEAAMAVLLVGAPWLVGFSHAAAARNYFVASGIALSAVWLLTDYRADQPVDDQVHGGRFSV